MATGGWSGLFDHIGGSPHSLLTRSGHRISRIVGRLSKTRGGAIAMGSEFALPGESYKRVAAPTDSQTNPTAMGGAITVETVVPTQISEANFIADVEQDSQPASYPTDASGNGGGDKLSGGWHL